MPVLYKSILISLGLLLFVLLQPIAWGEGSPTLQLPREQAYPSQETQLSALSGSGGQSERVSPSTSDEGQEKTGDGRGGFWIIGILVNLAVMGWFLAWAVKEWRKKR